MTLPIPSISETEKLAVLLFQVSNHEKRIVTLENDMCNIRDFIAESKMLRQLTLGGGFLSIVTLFMTIINLALMMTTTK